MSPGRLPAKDRAGRTDRLVFLQVAWLFGMIVFSFAALTSGCTYLTKTDGTKDGDTPERIELDADVSPIPAGSRLTTGVQADVGTPVAFGSRILVNEGTEPIKIEDISIADIPEGMNLIGILVSVAPDRAASGIGSAREFPANNPGADYQESEGVILPPKSTPEGANGMEISVGLEAKAEGRFPARGIRVQYEMSGRKYQVTYPDELIICTTPGSCT